MSDALRGALYGPAAGSLPLAASRAYQTALSFGMRCWVSKSTQATHNAEAVPLPAFQNGDVVGLPPESAMLLLLK